MHLSVASTVPFGGSVVDGRLMAVSIQTDRGLRRGVPTPLFPVRARQGQCEPSIDGTRFLINVGSGTAALRHGVDELDSSTRQVGLCTNEHNHDSRCRRHGNSLSGESFASQSTVRPVRPGRQGRGLLLGTPRAIHVPAQGCESVTKFAFGLLQYARCHCEKISVAPDRAR